jgi:5-methylthioadenosine/S-adenosylhomocysteine deaminase
MSEADARIAADHGVAFVRNAGSNLRLRSGIAPLAEYLRLGVPMAVGTDNLSLGEEEDLFSELRLAGALARSPFWDGPPPPDAAALFDMATIGGARIAGFDRVGVIEPGAKADLIAIRLGGVRGVWMSERIPLLDALVARAHGGDVALTMIGGRIAYRDGRILTLDVDRLRADAVTVLERTEPAVSAEIAERLASATRRFYGSRVDLDTLPPHWRPLALDRRRCH